MIPISSQSPTLPSHNSLNYELLSLTAICGEVPCACSSHLIASESYRKKVVTSLTHDKLLRIFSRHHLRGYRLGVRGKRLLLQQEPERFAFYLSGSGAGVSKACKTVTYTITPLPTTMGKIH